MKHDYRNIPQEMTQLKRWVTACEGNKMPMHAHWNKNASTSDPSTWTTFYDAMLPVELHCRDYLGFVFADDGIIGIDLDECFNGHCLSQIATDVIDVCKSYTEWSKSGHGLHIFLKGNLPFTGRNNGKGIEIYRDKRYFICTGNSIGDYPLIENQEAIDYIIKKYFPEIKVDSNRAYSPRQYNPVWDKPVEGKIPLRPKYPRIPQGCRNTCLMSLAGMLRSLGYNVPQMRMELNYANYVACLPPLPDEEVESIIKSVMRYAE